MICDKCGAELEGENYIGDGCYVCWNCGEVSEAF